MVRDSGVGDPPPSKKRKPSGTEALPREASKEPSGHAGIATNLMTSVKENLNLSEDPLLLEDETYRQLRLAQRSAHDAMSTAASALAQSHIAWSQIRTGDHSEIEIAREAQIASVAATVAAATSVAKAAVEAAKAIANVSMKDFWRGGDQVGCRSLTALTKFFGLPRFGFHYVQQCLKILLLVLFHASCLKYSMSFEVFGLQGYKTCESLKQ